MTIRYIHVLSNSGVESDQSIDCCPRYREMQYKGRCNFFASNGLNNAISNILNKMTSSEDRWYSIILSSRLLLLMAGCAQKDDYLYRKITNLH